VSLRQRVERLEKLLHPDDFCCECMVVTFRYADEPDPRPPVCPRCGRGPGDYPAGTVRGFVVGRPAVYGLKELQAAGPVDEQDEQGNLADDQ
jgi:hypothetical protein